MFNKSIIFIVLLIAIPLLFTACSETPIPANQEKSVDFISNGKQQVYPRALRVESAWSSPETITQYDSIYPMNNGLTSLRVFPKNNGSYFASWNPESINSRTENNLPGDVHRVFYRSNEASPWIDISPIAPTNSPSGTVFSHEASNQIFMIWNGGNQCLVNHYDLITGWSAAIPCGKDINGNSKIFFTGLSKSDGNFQAIFESITSDGSLILIGETYSPNMGTWQNSISLTIPPINNAQTYYHSPQSKLIGSDKMLIIWKQGYYDEPNYIVSTVFSTNTGWESVIQPTMETVSESHQLLLTASQDTDTAELVIAGSLVSRLSESYSISFDGISWGISEPLDIGNNLEYASNTNGDMLIAWVIQTGNAGLGDPLYSIRSKFFNSVTGWQPTFTVKTANLLSRFAPKTMLNNDGSATVGWIERSNINELFVSDFSSNIGWSTPELVRQSSLDARIGESFYIKGNQISNIVMWDEAETLNGIVTRTIFASHHQGGGQPTQPTPVQSPVASSPVGSVVSTLWTNAQQVWASTLSDSTYTAVFGPLVHTSNNDMPILHFQEYTGLPFLPNFNVKTHTMKRNITGDWINDSPIPADMDNIVRFNDLEFAFNETKNTSYSAWSTSDDRLYLSSKFGNEAWSPPILVDASPSHLNVRNVISNDSGVQIFWITDKSISTASYSVEAGITTTISIDMAYGHSLFKIVEVSASQYAAAVIERSNPISNINATMRIIKYQQTNGWISDNTQLLADEMEFYGFYPAPNGGAIILGRTSTVPIELTDSIASGPLSYAAYSTTTGWSNFKPVEGGVTNNNQVETTPFIAKNSQGELMMIWASKSLPNSSHSILISQLSYTNGQLTWSEPLAIGNTLSSPSFETRPILELANNGNVIALWSDTTLMGTTIWEKRYNVTTGWQADAKAVISLPNNDGYIINFDLIKNSQDSIFFVWKSLLTNAVNSSYSIFESETRL